jgi:transposase, IS30 family
MSKNYKHLCHEQRYQIEALVKSGHSQKYIAALIGVHPSTVSRELKRNTPASGTGSGQYWASNAKRRTQLRHRLKAKASYFLEEHKAITRQWLDEWKYSPELISTEGRRMLGSFVSHETIYKWIWACKTSHRKADRPDRKLYLKLKHGCRRQKRGNRHDKRGNMPYRVSVERRPAIVDKRKRLGDLEVDLMVGAKHQSAILVSLDRASLKVKLHKLLSKHSVPVKKALIRSYNKDRHWLRTITFDNDSAFMLHHKIAQALKVKTFFTRPYTSQDKGSIENRIGILRRFLPKRTDLNLITNRELKQIESKLNNRPVRKFNYKTPNQVFSEKIALMT